MQGSFATGGPRLTEEDQGALEHYIDYCLEDMTGMLVHTIQACDKFRD